MRYLYMAIIFFTLMTALLFPSLLDAKTNLNVAPPLGLFETDEETGEVDHQRIIDGLWQKVAEEPYNYENYGILAFVYGYIGDYEKSLEALKNAVAYLPDDAEGKDIYYGNLARAYMLNGQWVQGKEWLDQADSIDSHNFYNRWLAFDYYVQFAKDYRMAALELKRINELDPGPEHDAYYDAFLKSFYNEIGHEGLIKLFKEVIHLEPDNFKARRAYGVAIRNSSEEDFEKLMPAAMKEFKLALKLNPHYVQTYITIAHTHMMRGFYTKKEKYFKKALRWFEKGRRVDPKDMNVVYAIGNMFYMKNDYDKAIENLSYAYQNGLEDDQVKESLAFAYNGKAYDLYKSGKNLEGGLALIEKAIALKPDDGIILGTKAELLYKLGDYAQAHRWITKALEIEPGHEEMMQDLRMIEEAINLQKGE